MQGKRLNLDVSSPLLASTPVTVEYNDALFLGEVLICRKTGDSWKAEIKVEQILTGLQSLIALRARLLGESVSPAREHYLLKL